MHGGRGVEDGASKSVQNLDKMYSLISIANFEHTFPPQWKQECREEKTRVTGKPLWHHSTILPMFQQRYQSNEIGERGDIICPVEIIRNINCPSNNQPFK